MLRHEFGVLKRKFADELQAIYSQLAIKGRLHSSLTVQFAVEAMAKLLDEGLPNISDKVRNIVPEHDTFLMLSMALTEILDEFSDEMNNITLKASGRGNPLASDNIRRAAETHFRDMRTDIETRLKLLEYEFTPAMDNVANEAPAMVVPIAAKAGRPPAEFWDDMWAEVATALYTGDLKPQVQADIERAMTIWIETQGYSAAMSTIRKRARKLWDRLVASDG